MNVIAVLGLLRPAWKIQGGGGKRATAIDARQQREHSGVRGHGANIGVGSPLLGHSEIAPVAAPAFEITFRRERANDRRGSRVEPGVGKINDRVAMIPEGTGDAGGFSVEILDQFLEEGFSKTGTPGNSRERMKRFHRTSVNPKSALDT